VAGSGGDMSWASRGEELWLTDSKLFVWGTHNINGRTSLNWLD